MPGREKLSAALLLALSAHLSAQDQGFQDGQQQFNQAGSVSVDMATGEPVQAAPATEILAIYRGPGYFDESLLDISAPAPAEASTQPEDATQPAPPPLDDWSNPTAPTDQQEVLPPPPVLPPSPSEPASPQSQEDGFVSPAATAMDASAPAPTAIDPPPAQENSQSMPSTQDGGPGTPSVIAPQEGEPLPPPPMLEALPAFPQGE